MVAWVYGCTADWCVFARQYCVILTEPRSTLARASPNPLTHKLGYKQPVSKPVPLFVTHDLHPYPCFLFDGATFFCDQRFSFLSVRAAFVLYCVVQTALRCSLSAREGCQPLSTGPFILRILFHSLCVRLRSSGFPVVASYCLGAVTTSWRSAKGHVDSYICRQKGIRHGAEYAVQPPSTLHSLRQACSNLARATNE